MTRTLILLLASILSSSISAVIADEGSSGKTPPTLIRPGGEAEQEKEDFTTKLEALEVHMTVAGKIYAALDRQSPDEKIQAKVRLAALLLERDAAKLSSAIEESAETYRWTLRRDKQLRGFLLRRQQASVRLVENQIDRVADEIARLEASPSRDSRTEHHLHFLGSRIDGLIARREQALGYVDLYSSDIEQRKSDLRALDELRRQIEYGSALALDRLDQMDDALAFESIRGSTRRVAKQASQLRKAIDLFRQRTTPNRTVPVARTDERPVSVGEATPPVALEPSKLREAELIEARERLKALKN